MSRFFMAAGLALVAAAAGTACSAGESGEASPEPTTVTPSASTAPTNQSDDSGGSAPLADIDACSLLGSDELSKYGTFPEGEAKNVESVRGCSFQRDREPYEPGRLVTVNIRESAGVGEVNDMGMGVETTEANRRELAQVPGPGGCMIAIGVTDTSRVDIQVQAGEGTDKACEIADELAVTVEAKLPRE